MQMTTHRSKKENFTLVVGMKIFQWLGVLAEETE